MTRSVGLSPARAVTRCGPLLRLARGSRVSGSCSISCESVSLCGCVVGLRCSAAARWSGRRRRGIGGKCELLRSSVDYQAGRGGCGTVDAAGVLEPTRYKAKYLRSTPCDAHVCARRVPPGTRDCGKRGSRSRVPPTAGRRSRPTETRRPDGDATVRVPRSQCAMASIA